MIEATIQQIRISYFAIADHYTLSIDKRADPPIIDHFRILYI